jgi:hypothetical protein
MDAGSLKILFVTHQHSLRRAKAQETKRHPTCKHILPRGMRWRFGALPSVCTQVGESRLAFLSAMR